MSAPAAAYILTRATVASMPSTAIASVRALMMKSGSFLALTAASIFIAISIGSTSSLPRICPQRFGIS